MGKIASIRMTGLCFFFMAGIWNCANTFAAEFSFVGRTPDPHGYADRIHLQMSGAIEDGDVNKLRALLSKLESEKVPLFRTTTISLDSPGGALDPSIALANLIREYGIGTLVAEDNRCLSGCAIMFMAGTWRDGDDAFDRNLMLHPKGTLGFHAPFAFAGKDIPKEVQQLLLPDAERGGALAASKLVKLTLSDMMPVSLVEELLQYEAGTFLYIDTVDRAGRWNIPLVAEEPLKVSSQAVMTIHDSLRNHCDNLVFWNSDISFENRNGRTEDFPENTLVSEGMDTGCRYDPYEGEVSYSITGTKNSSNGTVLIWQTLPADTLLTSIAGVIGASPAAVADQFSNPPPSQVDGVCSAGHQWIGGWSGSDWRDSIAHATYRKCDGSSTLIRFECKHGTGEITESILLNNLGMGASRDAKVTSQIDNNYELSGGHIEVKDGALQSINTLPKGYFTFEQLKSGSGLVIRVNGNPVLIHLKGSRDALEAMEKSCL